MTINVIIHLLDFKICILRLNFNITKKHGTNRLTWLRTIHNTTDIFKGYEFSHASFPSMKWQHCLVCSKWFYSTLQKNCEILAYYDVTIKTVSFSMWCYAVCYLSTDVWRNMKAATSFVTSISSRHHSLDNEHLKIIMLTAY
jgi:hypothetical protein